MLRVPLLLLLVCPAAAYIRIATAVGGDVVKGAGDLTKGGKVGLYTVLLQAGMNIIVTLWVCLNIYRKTSKSI
jgi:hypothetical protein